MKTSTVAGTPLEIAAGVYWLKTGRWLADANVYFIRSEAGWVLIDAAWSSRAVELATAAGTLFGRASRPAAILLTHIHPDHAGSARPLAALWDTPVYAHRDELPLACGRYVPEYGNPLDRLVVVPMLHLMPRSRVRAMQERGSLTGIVRPFVDATVPGLPDWRIVHTPGHTPGHVAFFRPTDRVLVTGDAVLTIDLNSPAGLLGGGLRFAGPPYVSTWNRPAAQRSVARLAAFAPTVVASGHGRPRTDNTVAQDLAELAGRVVGEPAMIQPVATQDA